MITPDNRYQLLRESKIDEFNKLREKGMACDLRNCDMRSPDLHGINAAKNSGVLFPVELAPEEITLSLMHGARMRFHK